jgi:hypothetical protein
MKTIIFSTLLAFSMGVNAAATVDVATPENLYPEGYVTIDAPGTVRFDSGVNMDAIASWNIVSGTGEVYYEMGTKQIAAYPFHTDALLPKGYTCFDSCVVWFIEKLPAWSCPADGAILESSHLTVSLDGEVVYDEQQRVSDQVCFVTPAVQATKIWSAPVLTFDNSTQIQRSLSTVFIISDPNWLYSKHTFVADDGVYCSANMLNVGTRFRRVMKEVGFKCETSVPAYSTLSVTIN